MKYILSFFCILTFSLNCFAENIYKKTIRVYTLKEFIQALDDNTEIIIDADELNLTVSRLKLFVNEDSEKIQLDNGLQLKNFRNLKIRGANGRTSLFVKNEEEVVLTFTNSSNIVIENLNLYHNIPGFCHGEVLEIEDSENIKIYDCGLNGSGRIGLYIRNSKNIDIFDSEIYNNNDSMITIYDSQNILFSSTRFYENSTSYYLLDVNNSTLTFMSCIFEDNYTDRTFLNPIDSQNKKTKLYFKNCTFNNTREKEKGITPNYVFYSKEFSLDWEDYVNN